MGGKSESKSSSDQTTNTQNVTLQDTQGLNVAGIDNGTINITDAGQTARALDLGQSAIDGGVDIVSGLFSYLENSQNAAVNAVSDTAKLATTALGNTRPVNATSQTNGLYLLGGAAVVSWAVVNFYRRSKK